MIFKTDTGIEVPAVTTDQMREVDRLAIEESGPNLFQMMENAGRSLATLALNKLDKLGVGEAQSRVVVLAGSGGNGGGGICAARHLANRGLNVCLCLSNPEWLDKVPDFQRKIFLSAGGKEVHLEKIEKIKPQLILDALIGSSLSGAPVGSQATSSCGQIKQGVAFSLWMSRRVWRQAEARHREWLLRQGVHSRWLSPK